MALTVTVRSVKWWIVRLRSVCFKWLCEGKVSVSGTDYDSKDNVSGTVCEVRSVL